MCPCCRNTLSVVPSDPPDADDGRPLAGGLGVVGEPPFFLYCNHCRWDSAEVDITFEKPTGLDGVSVPPLRPNKLSVDTALAARLQKFEFSADESLVFERLKVLFEPFLRASSSSGHPQAAHLHPSYVNPI